jgi:hypothetical protein
VDEVDYIAYCQQVRDDVVSLLRKRYGRGSPAMGGRHGVGVVEAGYMAVVSYWALGQVLDRSGTSFRTLQLETRHDVLMADLLRFPEQPATPEWAALFGYVSADALGRAFRKRFDVGIADTRRIGTVGAWLARADRRPRVAAGLCRAKEAQDRIEAFRREVREPGLEARATLEVLGRPRGETWTARRPRYPAIGRAEVLRLGKVRA